MKHLPVPCVRSCWLFALCLVFSLALQAAETPSVGEDYDFASAQAWRGERIALPPEFAPDMKWKGVEEIKFSSGMFQSDAKDFFTYVIIFSLPEKSDVTRKGIQQEFLTYYQGLSSRVSQSRGNKVDPTTFKFDLKTMKSAGAPAKALKAKAYQGQLDWVEPFATAKRQTLHVEIHTYRLAGSKRHYLFACVSPQAPDKELWKSLRKIRTGFQVKPAKAKP